LTIFEEVYRPHIDINEDADDRSLLKNSELRLKSKVVLQSVVVTPFKLRVLVSCPQVDTPDVLLLAEILVDQEVFSAYANAYEWIDAPGLIDAKLEVVLEFLNLQ